MQQLLLNLDTASVPTLETFVPGQNAEVLHLFRQMAAGNSSDRFVYIWGDTAVGKTHLLRAMSQLRPARFLDPASPVAQRQCKRRSCAACNHAGGTMFPDLVEKIECRDLLFIREPLTIIDQIQGGIGRPCEIRDGSCRVEKTCRTQL